MKKIINKKIITNFMIISIIVSLASCTTSNNNKTLDTINSETGNINNIVNSGSNIGTNEKIVKLDSTYISPGGSDNVTFGVTTNNGLITNVICNVIKANKKSEEYISGFNDNINLTIKGKTIEEAKNIDTVGGATLTTNAFKIAISSI